MCAEKKKVKHDAKRWKFHQHPRKFVVDHQTPFFGSVSAERRGNKKHCNENYRGNSHPGVRNKI